MKKVKQTNMKKYIFLAITLIWIVFIAILLYIKNMTGYIILIDLFGVNFRQGDLFFVLLLIITTWIIILQKNFPKNYNNNLIKTFLVLFRIALVLAFLVFSIKFLGGRLISKYHNFNSPDKKHTIVVEETSFLFLGNIKLYNRINPIFIEDLNAKIYVDDGFTPISAERYWNNWYGSNFTLAVFDQLGNNTWNVVEISLENRDIKYKNLDSDGNPIIYKKNDTFDSSATINNKQLTKQEIVDELSIERAILIPNSNFGLIEIDRAMARIFWYFIKIENKRIVFISEAPDTAPNVEGKIDLDGRIYLKFTDINNNQTYYESTNQGNTWNKINAYP